MGVKESKPPPPNPSALIKSPKNSHKKMKKVGIKDFKDEIIDQPNKLPDKSFTYDYVLSLKKFFNLVKLLIIIQLSTCIFL
jgi:hypothetical protein